MNTESKSLIYSPKRDDEHLRPFYMGFLPTHQPPTIPEIFLFLYGGYPHSPNHPREFFLSFPLELSIFQKKKQFGGVERHTLGKHEKATSFFK